MYCHGHLLFLMFCQVCNVKISPVHDSCDCTSATYGKTMGMIIMYVGKYLCAILLVSIKVFDSLKITRISFVLSGRTTCSYAKVASLTI